MDIDVPTSGAKCGELIGIECHTDRRPARNVARILGKRDGHRTVQPGVAVMQMGGGRVVGTASVSVGNNCAGDRIRSDCERAGGCRVDDRHLLAAFRAAEREDNSVRDNLTTNRASRICGAVDIDIGLAGEQRGALRHLFGKQVRWIAAILHESDLDGPGDATERAVQMNASGVIQAIRIGVQRQ